MIIEPYSGSMQPYTQTIRLANNVVQASSALMTYFQAEADGVLTQVQLTSSPDEQDASPPTPLGVSLTPSASDEEPVFSTVALRDDPTGLTYTLDIVEPLPVTAGENYQLTISMEPSGGRLQLAGIGVANEGEWDDGLPLRMDGYDGFGGIYPLDLNFNMYWDDNIEKVERFIRILDESEYLVISSNRQWGSLTRHSRALPDDHCLLPRASRLCG